MLQELKVLSPLAGTDSVFNNCVATRDLLARRPESSIDCACFGWGEEGFDVVSTGTASQKYNGNGPWQDIPCYQRRADNGTEWRHSVDHKTCVEVATQLLGNHQLCDWEYSGYCCECHGLDARFHANPESPWFDETFDEQCSDVAIPTVLAAEIASKTVEILRSSGDNDAGWVRLDLQYSTVISEVKIELDLDFVANSSQSTRADNIQMLWRALKHYEIQIGDDPDLDANPVYAQYQTGDETLEQCKDCQSELVSVDPDLLMWLQFDDLTFPGKDSSNYKTDARVATQAVVATKSTLNQTLPSVSGPLSFGSLVLNNANYLEMGTVELQAQSDFAISFWFVGMTHPSPGRKHVILEMASDNRQSFLRVEQNWHNPSVVTTVLTVQNNLALEASSRSSLGDLIYTPASVLVVVGGWNHYTLSVKTNTGSAYVCLNSECNILANGEQAADGDTYSVRGMGAQKLVLRSHMNDGAIAFCPEQAGATYACYQGQLDEVRVYRRAMSIDEIQQLSTPRASAVQGGLIDESWQKRAYIPWLNDNFFLQHAIAHVKARYILLKFPACDVEKIACNTRHRIPLASLDIDRQKWHFDNNSAWSWSGDSIPDTFSQEPWFGGKGLCFQHDMALFAHRAHEGSMPLFVEMDLQNIKALSGLVFAHVPGSSGLGLVRVYYDINPTFASQHSRTMDLSTLSTAQDSLEIHFDGDPLRVRYVRIVLEQYPDGPPCISVAPIICSHYCAGCCQTVQTVDPSTLGVLQIAAEHKSLAPVQVWQTAHKKCHCVHPEIHASERGFVSERIFTASAEQSEQSEQTLGAALHFYHCLHSMRAFQDPYDNRDSKYTLQIRQPAAYGNASRSFVSDGIIDLMQPQPIILIQGVATVIDWSGVDESMTPVYIADQAIAKTRCTGIMALFVTVDTDQQHTSILVPPTYANFKNLKFFFYYAHDSVPRPVPVIAVDAATQYRIRSDLFCTFSKKYTDVHTLCDCNSQLGHVDPWGVPLNAILAPILRSQIASDDTLPLQYTHMLLPENGETIRADDHIFETQPQPATQAPFFEAGVRMDLMESGGEFLHTTNTRAVIVNRFGELDNIGVLYKDVSYAEDPFLCARANASQTCGTNWTRNTSNTEALPLLHTQRTSERNRWRAIELQTEESYFGAGGAGFVQRLLPGEDWDDDISIHLTPHIGINVRYPSNSERVFRNAQREVMYRNYDTGTPIHMSVFIASKKLNISTHTNDWDWIRCGSMTQNAIPYPPTHFSTSISLPARYNHGPNKLINSLDTTVLLAETPSLGNIFYTAFASHNAWVSQGGFLPDPPVCWPLSRISAGAVSAQAPLGGNVATHTNNPACKIGQLSFPGVNNSALDAGYVRCDLSKNLKTDQILPCMYTVADIMRRYEVTDADLELRSDFQSVYQISVPNSSAAITNRRGSDIFTQKIAYGSRKDTDRHGGPLYVCHPQYNNLPYLTENERIVLRPDIACALPPDGMSPSLITECVCGIIARTYTIGDTLQHVEKIIRVIPKVDDGHGTSSVPSHVFITELDDNALRTGDVLSIGSMTASSTKTLPTVYFASDPSAAAMHATSPSLPAQYDICEQEMDPDNANSTNEKNPYILDGIVVPLGKTRNPDKDEEDCCNFIHPHARIIALHKHTLGSARVAFVEGGTGAITGRLYSELWNTVPVACTSIDHGSTDLDLHVFEDTNEYPCSLNTIALENSSTSEETPNVRIFNKVYVKTRGWMTVLFSMREHGCVTSDAMLCVEASANSTDTSYAWQVEHVRTVSSVQEPANNYNIPNDAHLWRIGDLLFGGVYGVGQCAGRCPSSAEYDNIQGTIKWKPLIPPPAPEEGVRSFWLYTVFSVGESPACKYFNCDELGFMNHHAVQYDDNIPNPDGLHPITFFEGTSITAFVPLKRNIQLVDGCFHVHLHNATLLKNMWMFSTSTALFGAVNMTDFAACTSCTSTGCKSDVLPCQWHATVDAKLWYYMHIYFENGEFNVFTFSPTTPVAPDTESNSDPKYTGYVVLSTENDMDPLQKAVARANNNTATIFTTQTRSCASSSQLLRRSQSIVLKTQQSRTRYEHGRKTHVRSYSKPIATQKSLPIASKKPVVLQRAEIVMKTGSAASRFLLSLDSSSSRASVQQQQVVIENRTQNSALTRKITSIDNNEKVTQVVCASKQSYTVSCDMLVIEKEVQISTFCQKEDSFMWTEGNTIRAQMLNASSASISDVVITSVARAHYASKCAYAATRRLLQTEIVHITYVVVASGRSFIDSDVLMSAGFSGLRRVTASEQSNLTICSLSKLGNTQLDTSCAWFYSQMDPVPPGGQVNAAPSTNPQPTTPYFDYPSTTPHYYTQNSTNTSGILPNVQGNHTQSSFLVAILAGVGGLIFITLCVALNRYMHAAASQQHTEPTETYIGIHQTESNAFFHNGQLVYHTYG